LINGHNDTSNSRNITDSISFSISGVGEYIIMDTMNNILTDDQVKIMYSIMVIRYVKDNDIELNEEFEQRCLQHNLTGLARKQFEIEFLNRKIRRIAAKN